MGGLDWLVRCDIHDGYGNHWNFPGLEHIQFLSKELRALKPRRWLQVVIHDKLPLGVGFFNNTRIPLV
ncbi:MAG: hypothetical protein EOM85_01185 [Candidatus Moranbacteria bacterium]|nr:hypothetical protein [Candidatus Moranbacteria bacterium]